MKRSAFKPSLPVSAIGASLLMLACPSPVLAQDAPQADGAAAAQVAVAWDDITNVSGATPTFQTVVMPQMLPGSPLRKPILDSMAGLKAKNIRLVPWFTSPRLSVAQLSPPGPKRTSWDFRNIDSQVIPFLEATKGMEPVLNFSVIPRWMFKTTGDVTVPAELDKIIWNYSSASGTGAPVTGGDAGADLVDPSGQQIGDYYGRVVSWYTKGGFTDEKGVYHKSGHAYTIPWWEVLSELDNGLNVKQYTKLYDVIVASIKAVSPQTKFTGLNLWCPSESCTPANIEYFLDPKNHAPGIPIDAIGYHSYIVPTAEQTAEHWQYTFFQHADQLLDTVRFVEQIKNRLRPEARIDLNEVGCILPGDMMDVGRGAQGLPPLMKDVPPLYWNACGAYYAYVFAGFAQQGIDVVVRKSQLYGYPGQFATVSMLYPETGRPNARYQVLDLLVRNFRSGDKLARTTLMSPDVAAQAFVTEGGKRLLLVNKRNRRVSVSLKDVVGQVEMEVVDPESAGHSPRRTLAEGGEISLNPFAVAVLAMN